MNSSVFHHLAQEHCLTTASGMAYGMLSGCFVTLSDGEGYQRISIYVGPQEAPAPGYAESQTVSCSQQIIHMISAASGADNAYGLKTGDESLPSLILNHAGSVVTVTFGDTEEANVGLKRFIAELLPQIAPLTRPQLCITCCQPTEGAGCPVRLSGDTVVPMHHPCFDQINGQFRGPSATPREVVHGILGAALGALVGGMLYALIYHFGYVARIGALLIGLLASWGYDLFKGRPGRHKIITVVLCSLVACALATLGGCMLPLLHKYATLGDATRAMFTELSDGMPTWLTYLRANLASASGSFWSGFGIDLLIGLLFTGAGCLDLLRQAPSAAVDAAKPRRMKGSA